MTKELIWIGHKLTKKPLWNNIRLLPHARIRARPCCTRRPDKRHMEKTLPEVHGDYKSSIQIYKETNINLKLLADNLLWNYFMVFYQRHIMFVPFMYTFLRNNNVSNVLKKPCKCIFKTTSSQEATGKTVSFSVIKTEVATNTRHQNEFIFILFVKGGQVAGVMEVRVTLFYVKPNTTILLCYVWQFVDVVYDSLYIFLWKTFYVVNEIFYHFFCLYCVLH